MKIRNTTIKDVIQARLEKYFYFSMKDTGLVQDCLDKFPDESVEDIADLLAKGFYQGRLGDIARSQCKGTNFPDYDKVCEMAFKNVVLKLLKKANRSVK